MNDIQQSLLTNPDSVPVSMGNIDGEFHPMLIDKGKDDDDEEIANHVSKRTLCVMGLHSNVTADLLKSAFIPFGVVQDISLPMDHKTAKHKGFAFIQFEEAADAMEAVANMNESELYGKTIRVSLALEKTNTKM
mmetsp:Transcript_18514/g.32141  ORF Transcript_18514/g.32141 Transcript_18514/m.32141 type:complete len:134 (-) Transcript_18514:114-515(-)